MPSASLARSLYIALAAIVALPTAAAAAPLEAYVSRTGEVTIRRSNTGQGVATVRPGLFEAGWQYRAVGTGPDGGAIRARDGAVTIAVVSRAAVDGSKLRLSYRMTPSAALTVNSVHVSVNVPVADWLGAEVAAGAARVTVPTAAGDAHLAADPTGRVRLARGRRTLTVDGGGLPVLVQDNRVFSAQELELRVGAQVENGAWAANDSRAIEVTVDLGEEIDVLEERPLTIQAGPDWEPLDPKLDIVPGSALDFSFLSDTPAGKHGPVVIAPGGHFAFQQRPRTPVRFYGVNLCFSANYPEHAEADRLAERLMRLGYNSVRIHHFEMDLTDPNAPDSLTFLPDRLDRLDYLVSALKKRGMYLKTDLYISRQVRPSEAPGRNFKVAVLVSDRAMDNWKAFVGKLLRHVNPYTKVAWKDEPALAWLSVMNEGTLLNYLGGLDPELKGLIQQRWDTWLRARYPTDEALRAAWADPQASLGAAMPTNADNTARGRDLGAFTADLHARAFRTMKAFLRQEVGTQALLTDLNGWSDPPALATARNQLDWVDNHFYWDHPHFLERDWNLPTQGGSGGGSALSAGGAGAAGMSMTRLVGKPFSVSEFNYTAPNPFRAESGLLIGAAGAIQDWDVLWRFAYSHSRANLSAPGALGFFDMAGDPLQVASERAGILMFLRRDVATPRPLVAHVRQVADLVNRPRDIGPVDLADLTYVTRVGVRLQPLTRSAIPPLAGEVRVTSGAAGAALTALREQGLVPQAHGTDLARGVRQSLAGDVTLDAGSGKMAVTAPRLLAVVAPAGETATAGALTARIDGARAVVYAASLDGKPVAQSRRILVAHLTDLQNTGIRFRGPDRRVLEDWGGLPHLVRAGTARLTLACGTPAAVKAWRLDTAGNRVAPVPVRVDGASVVVELTTRAPGGGATMYYELAAD